tara:strand:+ start:1445 stop:1765 length:321 start_codon:yes stop_codon:yes gene_type:complete
MKNYVLTIVMALGMTIAQDTSAHPNTIVDTSKPKLELKIEPEKLPSKSYSPIWIVEEASKNKMQKFIWVPLQDGNSLVLEASNSAILRLAWNPDTYRHDQTKTKTN